MYYVYIGVCDTVSGLTNTDGMTSSEETQTYTFESWNITAFGSHILQSECNFKKGATSSSVKEHCHHCRFVNNLKLPELPEMVFHLNSLRITYGTDNVAAVTTAAAADTTTTSGIEFNALDSLKGVLIGEMPLKVAYADKWQSFRQETGLMKNHPHVFDWTYTTEYAGTIFGNVTVTPTELEIDIEKLKQREKILFYQDRILFEDELHDNGIALLSIKIRVMPSGFFILMRYFLRIDNLLVRVIDTRLYYSSEFKNFLIRERSYREAKYSETDSPYAATNEDPSIYAHLLPVKYIVNEKLTFAP